MEVYRACWKSTGNVWIDADYEGSEVHAEWRRADVEWRRDDLVEARLGMEDAEACVKWMEEDTLRMMMAVSLVMSCLVSEEEAAEHVGRPTAGRYPEQDFVLTELGMDIEAMRVMAARMERAHRARVLAA